MYSDRLPGNAFLIIPFLVYADLIEFILPANIYPDSNGGNSALSVSPDNKKVDKLRLYIPAANLLPGICGVLGLLLLFLICYKIFSFNFPMCLITMIIDGLCTHNQLESSHLFSHAPSMLCITFSIYIALNSKQSSHWKRSLYGIAGVIGFSTMIELQNILFFFPLFFYVTKVNKHACFKDLSTTIKLILTCIVIIGFFIGVLLMYNYFAFDEFILKSNKYNAFFPEERSFFTALSGNLFQGLDRLFTSFHNIRSYWNWSHAIHNDIPGLFAGNPVFLFSVAGFIPFFKKYTPECILFLTLILISVSIASLHVTTLVRHIFTINMLLFMPFIFFLNWVRNLSRNKALIFYTIIFLVALLSFIREAYMTNHYYRNYPLGKFQYIHYTPLFIFLNLPLFLWIIYRIRILKLLLSGNTKHLTDK